MSVARLALPLLALVTFLLAARLAPHQVPGIWRLPYTASELGDGMDPATAAALDSVRQCTQRRYRLRSGWRSEETNRRVGGASNSQHLHGRAVDLTVPHSHRDTLYACARAAGFTGFGWGSRTTHLDRGPARWWTYDDRGRARSGAAAMAHLHKAPASFRRDHGLE